jgi:hypothetical protein
MWTGGTVDQSDVDQVRRAMREVGRIEKSASGKLSEQLNLVVRESKAMTKNAYAGKSISSTAYKAAGSRPETFAPTVFEPPVSQALRMLGQALSSPCIELVVEPLLGLLRSATSPRRCRTARAAPPPPLPRPAVGQHPGAPGRSAARSPALRS